MMPRVAITVLLLIASGLPAGAQPPAAECAAIPTPTERLACYDAKAPPVVVPAQPIEKTRESRMRFAANLRRNFLENGLPFLVLPEEKLDPKSVIRDVPKHFPKLSIMGYFNDATVYQLAGKAEILSNAAALGFKAVDFFSQAGNGRYFFEIIDEKVPRCDISKRVCF